MCSHRASILSESFAETVPNYEKFPIVTKTLAGVEIDRHVLRLTAGTAKQEQFVNPKELTDDILMLTTPILYGFSLSDKTWRTQQNFLAQWANSELIILTI